MIAVSNFSVQFSEGIILKETYIRRAVMLFYSDVPIPDPTLSFIKPVVKVSVLFDVISDTENFKEDRERMGGSANSGESLGASPTRPTFGLNSWEGSQ